MSWESSLEYYRIINRAVNNKLGGLHSAKSILYSVDFEVIEKLQRQGDWEELTKIMIESAQRLESAGADMIIICTNTMHKMAEDMEKHINVPLLHIADATALKIKDYGLKKIGLLGTKFTMEQDFYKGRLINNYGLEVIVPDTEERQIIHDIIYNELCLGEIKESSKLSYIKVIDNLEKKGAEGVILGCTEIPLLIKQTDVKIPLFDTTKIHAEFAVDFSIK
jgi:aspartate racemase